MNFTDLHADIPLSLYKNIPSAVDLTGHPFNRFVQVAAIFIEEGVSYPYNTYRERLYLIKDYLRENNIPLFCKGIRAKTSVVLAVENAAFLAKDPDLIYTLKRDGISMLSLSWNGDNFLAGGAKGVGEISPLGFKVIEKINSLNMALDISHLNNKSALQAVNAAKIVLASHSNCYSLLKNSRNLKDSLLLKLKAKNGLVGLCFYPPFFGEGLPTAELTKNIEHLIKLGMEDNIAIGSDFDGGEMSKSLCETADVLSLYRGIYSKNITKKQKDKIFYLNAIAFLEKICENRSCF